jgi:hypothetical protein
MSGRGQIGRQHRGHQRQTELGYSLLARLCVFLLLSTDAAAACGESIAGLTLVDGHAAIPEGTVDIPTKAFFQCDGLVSVTIAASVKTIANSAFFSCPNLVTITLAPGTSFSSVGRNNCGLSIPGLTFVDGHAVIPEGTVDIPENAFYQCVGLVSVAIPTSVTTVGINAFRWCDELASVFFPASVQTVGQYAFDFCPKLTYVCGLSAPGGSIGYDAFANTPYDAEVWRGSVAESARAACPTTSAPTDAPTAPTDAPTAPPSDAPTSVPTDAPTDAPTAAPTNDGDTNAPTDVPTAAPTDAPTAAPTAAPTDAPTAPTDAPTAAPTAAPTESSCIFNTANTQGCSEPYYGSSSTQTLGNGQLAACHHQNAGVCNTHPLPMGDCCVWALDSDSDGAPTAAPTETPTDAPTAAPTAAPTDAAAACGESIAGLTLVDGHAAIPEGTVDIPTNAFRSCDGLVSVTIAASVKTIANSAFFSCPNLVTITLAPTCGTCTGCKAEYADGSTDGHDNCWTASWATEEYCRDTTSPGQELTWCGSSGRENLVASFSSVGWDNCGLGIPGLTFVDGHAAIPEGTVDIPRNAFSYCYGLVSVAIPASVTTVGYNGFDNCPNLVTITLAPGTSFSSVYENNCGLAIPGLTFVDGHAVIPEGTVDIPEYAFYQCDGLVSVAIPTSVTTVGSHAFGWCDELASVFFPASVQTVGQYAFDFCPKLTYVCGLSAPGGSIGMDAFGSTPYDGGCCTAVAESARAACPTTSAPTAAPTAAPTCPTPAAFSSSTTYPVYAGSSNNYWNYCNYMVTADCSDMCANIPGLTGNTNWCSDECDKKYIYNALKSIAARQALGCNCRYGASRLLNGHSHRDPSIRFA